MKIHGNLRNIYRITAMLVLPVFIIIAGCGGEKVEPLPDYEGWGKYSYQHFVFHYPEGSYWGRNIDRLSQAYEKYLQEDCTFLGLPLPKDTIHFFIHNNDKEMEELTGHNKTFITGNQIHWDRIPPFGTPLAIYLVDNMGIRRTDYDFLYDGLITLRDYSGSDYHHNTASLQELKRFIPLDSLIDNERYSRQNKRDREWEAASFIAFITYNFGINRFKMLWQSTASFETAIKELFGVDMKTFEEKWVEFALVRYQGIHRETIYTDSSKTE